MKIVFIAINTENLAVEYLASYLKQHGHQAELVFDPYIFGSEAINLPVLANLFDTKKEIIQQVLAKEPDVVGFSLFTFNYQRALHLARELKKFKPNLPIIFGGIHPTCVPEQVIQEECVDMVCVGEGEEALADFLNSLQIRQSRYDIKNIWFKKEGQIIQNPLRHLIDDLDQLPFPDKELFYQVYSGFKKDYLILSSRGCPFKCAYCANHVLHKIYQGLGPIIRRRSPENVIQELVWAKHNFKPGQVTFVDDIFVQSFDWLERFISLYQEKINLPYVVLTHPIYVDFKTAKLLKDSGCYLLMFGIQSASEDIRQIILNRAGTNEQIEAAAQACQRAKLHFSIDHIFNIPGEGASEYLEALKFYNQLRPSIINSFWLQYFPKTEIIQTAIERGIMNLQEVGKIEQGLFSTSVVVGLGGKDNFSPKLIYTNFQFWFMLLPILPQWLMTKIIQNKKMILNFKPPMLLNVAIKFMTNLFKGRGSVYGGIIKSLLYFMKYNLILKIANRKL